MSKEVIGGPFEAAGAVMPFPKAVRANGFVFVSGQMATDSDGRFSTGSIEEQTRQVLDNIKGILAEAGCELGDVVKCTCWIDDPRDFGRFNAAYRTYFGDDPPARSTVRSQLMLDGKLEVEAIAYKPL